MTGQILLNLLKQILPKYVSISLLLNYLIY